MRVFNLMVAAAAATALSSCGGSTSNSDDSKASGEDLSAMLAPEQQQARLKVCMAALAEFQKAGVWKHGGAEPGVDLVAWAGLSSGKKDRVFQTAACLAAAGQIGEREVTIKGEGAGAPIETRRVPNDRSFPQVSQ